MAIQPKRHRKADRAEAKRNSRKKPKFSNGRLPNKGRWMGEADMAAVTKSVGAIGRLAGLGGRLGKAASSATSKAYSKQLTNAAAGRERNKVR